MTTCGHEAAPRHSRLYALQPLLTTIQWNNFRLANNMRSTLGPRPGLLEERETKLLLWSGNLRRTWRWNLNEFIDAEWKELQDQSVGAHHQSTANGNKHERSTWKMSVEYAGLSSLQHQILLIHEISCLRVCGWDIYDTENPYRCVEIVWFESMRRYSVSAVHLDGWMGT